MTSMEKPIFLTIGDVMVVLDIQPKTDKAEEWGRLYFSSDMDGVRSYDLDLDEMNTYRETGRITVNRETSSYVDFWDTREQVDMSEETHLMYPKADILAHLDAIGSFFSGR